MNGDIEMQNADEQCDTVAILDAGAQYGKVLLCSPIFVTMALCQSLFVFMFH